MKNIQLTHTLRLPDNLQFEALRFLEASRLATNLAIEALWPRLDEVKGGEGPAWKQITAMISQQNDHGCRQWRCEAETAGRILRSQASRKTVFNKIFPILSESLIVPIGEKNKRIRKNRKVIFEKIGLLREELANDAENTAYMLNVIEQACNFYIKNEKFPANFEELQPVPVLKTGLLTYAADDGSLKGQTYRYTITEGVLDLQLKTPNENNTWRWLKPVEIPLPEETVEFVKDSSRLSAPTLRAVEQADGTLVAWLDIIIERAPQEQTRWENQENVLGFDWGVRKLLTVVVLSPDGDQLTRPFYLDTGGFDGQQARLKRNIEQLLSKRDLLPEKSAKRRYLQREIDMCWNAYSKRNQALAHFCSNYLLLLAEVFGSHAIAGEWLSTLKTVGRGKYTRSRWRNWRNNTTVRSAITNILKYKCKLAGVKLRFEQPRGTSHTCPRCGNHADTFKSPEHDQVNDWGAWMKCFECGWNGSRDYAAAINIARLGVAFFKKQKQDELEGKSKSYAGFRIDKDKERIKPASYIGVGTALPALPSGNSKVYASLLPSRKRNAFKQKTYFAGWQKSVTMHPLLPATPDVYVCLHF